MQFIQRSLKGLIARSVVVQYLFKLIYRQWLQVQYRYFIYKTATLKEALRYNPLKVVTVSLEEINRQMTHGRLFREYTPGSVVGGGWDQETEPFTDSIHYRGLKQRFFDGKEWEETELYKSAISREPGRYYHNCKTESEVLSFLRQYDDIYESMESDGYLSQRELREKGDSFNIYPAELNEIQIHIDRNGDIIFQDGRHRLAMAKLLDIGEVPAIITVRHRDWWKEGGFVNCCP